MTELEIFKKCVSLGMTQAGAAGCTANILTESAGRPNNVEDRCPLSDEAYTKGVDDGSYTDFIDDRYGYGLCQWTLPSRKKAFLEYAKGHGVTALSGSDLFYCNTDTKTVNALILRYAGGVVTTANTDRIKGLRDVYVPNALISSYQTASNWSTRYAAGKITFHAIEGSPYEHAYADGTPIPTT